MKIAFLFYRTPPVFFKGAKKLYFVYYLREVTILFSKGLYKSAFFTYSFGKTRFSYFCVLVFRVSVSLAFNFYFYSMFWIQCLLKDLITMCNNPLNTNHTKWSNSVCNHFVRLVLKRIKGNIFNSRFSKLLT